MTTDTSKCIFEKGAVDIIVNKIKNGGAGGTDTSDATAAANDIASGKTAYVNGEKITGTMTVGNWYSGTAAPSSSVGEEGDLFLVVY